MVQEEIYDLRSNSLVSFFRDKAVYALKKDQHVAIIRAEASQDTTAPNSRDLHAYCDFYQLMYQIETQVGGIEAITPSQLSSLASVASENVAIAVDYKNVLQYLEIREIDDLLMLDINFGNIQKSPQTANSQSEENSEELPTSLDFKLYPNPAQTEVHVQYDINDLSTQAELRIFDISGQLIYQKSIFDQHNELILRVSDYDKGIYVVSITSENGEIVTKKLIIQ